MSTLKTTTTFFTLFIFTFLGLSGAYAGSPKFFETVFLSGTSNGSLFAIQYTGMLPMASVEPRFEPGNPSCTSLGYNAGFKIEPVQSGEYTITGTSAKIVIDVDGAYFDWTSTIGIDAVIVKGGPNANVYEYEPPSMGDTDLHAPINSSNGNPYGLSHLEFCYSPALTVTKTANATYTRTFDWDIEKSVTPGILDMFNGDSGSVDYTVVVTKDEGTDSDFAVTGTITIANNSGFDALVTGVTDSINGIADPIPVECENEFGDPVTFGSPYLLLNGDSIECTYSSDLPDATDRINTATVTTQADTDVAGGTATAAVDFGDPTTIINDSIDVTDTVEGDLGTVSDDTTFEYPRTFTCGEDDGEHPNTASFTSPDSDLEGSDDASVTVNCYALNVTKDATTTYTRTWTWDIEKTGPDNIGPVNLGQPVTVSYDVTVTGSYLDSSWAVSGNIAVYNPAPIAATINSVTDAISGVGNATVDCGVSFPYSLAAGGTLNCTYSSPLPDAASRTNTATATLQNSPSGTTDFTGNANVTFGDPSSIIDECVDVVDDNATPGDTSDDLDLGTFCATTGSMTHTFEFDRDIELPECGEVRSTNIASFTTNDTGATGSDDHTVAIEVACEPEGCTLTPGYWKTHAKSLFVSGPRYDETWNEFKNVPVEGIHNDFDMFYLSDQNYIEVLWTPPAGNPYYNLSFHYIAAQLNILAGADGSSIEADMDRAEEIFSTYTPEYIGGLKGNNALRQEIIAIAGRLGQFNEGTLPGGPEHCDTSATPF